MDSGRLLPLALHHLLPESFDALLPRHTPVLFVACSLLKRLSFSL